MAERRRRACISPQIDQSTKNIYFSLFRNGLQTPFPVGIFICPRRAFGNDEQLKTLTNKHVDQRRGALSASGLVDLWSAWRPPVWNVTDSNCVLPITYCQYRLQLLLYEFPVSVKLSLGMRPRSSVIIYFGIRLMFTYLFLPHTYNETKCWQTKSQICNLFRRKKGKKWKN